MSTTAPTTLAGLALALAQFDADYGRSVANALELHAKDMREVAAECQGALDGTLPERPVLHLTAAQVQQLNEAAGLLAVVLDSIDDNAPEATALLAAVTAILPVPPEPGTTIKLNPTESGVRNMARMFTEAAGKSDAALEAWETLAGQAEQMASQL